MAVLEKIRVKFGIAASIIIALGLLSFIIDPNELISAFNNMSSKYDVGEINGKSISYNDFQENVQQFTTINEMMTGGSAQNAQQQAQIRDAAWQDLVYKHLFNKNARLAGLNVGDEELVDLTTGSNLSPLIAQNPAFAGEDGSFSKEELLRFVQNLDSDASGNLRTYWNYLQTSIYNNQLFEKYNALFTNGNITNPLMMRKMMEENNSTTDVEFVMVPYGYAQDSTIVVSDDEIRSYYNNHKKFYRQTASRDIEYVVFEVVPSAEDIAATNNEIVSLREEFEQTDNVRSFIMKNSDRSYSDHYYKTGELTSIAQEIEDFVWGNNAAEAVSPVVAKGNNFYVARVVDSRMVPDSVYVRHILFQGDNAQAQADSVLDVINKGGNFSALATLHSVDQGSADGGERGNIGWMTQNYIIPGFESLLTAEVGKPATLKTQYGVHVVEVTKRTKPILKKQVAILEKEALASKETFNAFYSKANAFATAAAAGYDAYKKAADEQGVYSHPMNNMPESADRLGAIENTKEVTRWAFDNKPGKVSQIITVDNNYFFVATVKAAHKEGIADVKEVASTIRQQLYYEKLGEKVGAQTAEKIQGLTDLQAIAEKLNTTVSTESGIAFSSLNAQGLDPKFIGALSVAPEGKICGPVVGSIGAYVFKVTGRDTGSYFTEDDAKMRESQMSQYTSQMIIPVMMQDADVKDNRARFF